MFVEDAAQTYLTQRGMALIVDVTRGTVMKSRHEVDAVVVGLVRELPGRSRRATGREKPVRLRCFG